MRKNLNAETIEGRVYQHNLTLKTVQNQQSENFGKEFINGTLDVATDEEGLNIITVHYTYVTEITKNGKQNATYSNLKKIIDGKTWVMDGKDQATKVRLTTSAALNDFFPQGGDVLVSQPTNEGGFVSIVSDAREGKAKFEFDTVITNVELVEATPDNNETEDYAKISCAIFNFRNDILPFTLIARESFKAGSLNYFLGLNASPSNPVYTQVKGEIVSTTVKVQKVIESAFGDPVVDFENKRRREWIVDWAKPDPYIFDDPSTITAEELSKAIADRNVYLEEVKTRAKEYYNAKGSVVAGNNAAAAMPAPNPSSQIPVGGFNF